MRRLLLVAGLVACGRVGFDGSERPADAPEVMPDAFGTVSGSFVGDGSASYTVEIGLQPCLVLVRDGTGSGAMVFATSNMPPGLSREIPYPNGGFISDAITALTSTGFIVGSNWQVNGAGRTIYWTAWPASSNIVLGSYTGNGTSQTITVGLEPAWLWVYMDGQNPVQRFAVDPATDTAGQFNDNGGGAGIITSVTSTGFQVGSAPESNSSGVTYYYVAFRAAAGFLSIGAYTGTGADQTVSGLGVTPEIVFTGVLGDNGIDFHSDSMGAANDITFPSAGGLGAMTGHITALLSTNGGGFSLGPSGHNTSGRRYAYAVFAR